MKKYFSLLILTLISIFIIGCTQGNTPNTPENLDQNTTTQTENFKETQNTEKPVEESAKETQNSSEENPSNTSNESSMETTNNPVVIMTTSLGDIEISLNQAKAPISVKNFLEYVDAGFYNGTVFHRVIKGFMVQGGGMDKNLREKPTNAPIKNEAQNGLKNTRGTIAMARTGIVDSATSQFFINTVDNAFLDNGSRDFGYAVFGEVTQGMDIVEKIENTPTAAQDVPTSTIEILSVKRK